jgi:hypothetical protein
MARVSPLSLSGETMTLLLRKVKERWGRVYKATILGAEYIFRPLRVGEYRDVSIMEDMEAKELKILSTSLLSPKVNMLDDLLSGVAELLISMITNVTDINENSLMRKVSEARDRLGITDNILGLQIEIVKNLNYTPDQVYQMDFEKFVESICLVEAMTGKPLVAAQPDTSPRVSTEVDRPGDPQPIEIADVRDMSQMQDVADRNAENLRVAYLKRKGKYG